MANGATLNIIEAEPRAGDPPDLVAIAESALVWERSQREAPWRNE